ncbi:thiazole synthase [bacterium]|nr:thiazole synthase [bacterium]MBU3955952.1 thiazole synthase [bacterium]MBU4133736.1 thiazole synthase [bacterium]
MKDILNIGGVEISSRLFVGTGKFSSKSVIKEVLTASEAAVVTVAMRRVDFDSGQENVLDYIPKSCVLMVNTSGARNADEAVRIARLAEASGCGKWVKLEIIPDAKYLLPDNEETVRATELLAREGFVVFPYMIPDLISAKKMENAGAAAVMPLGSPIGSGRGVRTKELVRIMVDEIKVPVIVDAGLGSPSDAALCMEMGCGAVLVNTAIAIAGNPVEMALAFSLGVRAGRLAYLAGVSSTGKEASPSSPLTGFLRD